MSKHLSMEWKRLDLTSWKVIAALLAAVLVIVAITVFGWRAYTSLTTNTVTAYFANTNGIYVGDDVKIMGVNVGTIDDIQPDGDRMKVRFHYDSAYSVPADAKAVVLSQSLISTRAIQLAPAYSGGPVLADDAEIPQERTAVPVEWDDFREQLERLSADLGPTEANKEGALGGAIDSAADLLDGKGDSINDTITKLSDSMTTLSDGRKDLFGTIQHLQVFVSALRASDRQIVEINGHLASVTGAMTDTDDELGKALGDVDMLTGEIRKFIEDNRAGATKSLDNLASVTSALNESKPDIEQILHIAPSTFANFYNIYQPAQGALTGELAVTQFQNPLQFICGAIQATGRMGAEESAKLCAHYLAPVLKSLQFNYPPVGVNPADGVQVRPEQVDYSEDRLRPGPGQSVTSVPGVFSNIPTTATQIGKAAGLAGLLGIPATGGTQNGGGR